MSDDLIKRMRSQEAVDGRPHEIEQLTDEAAAMIEQQTDQLLDARRTAEYWKAEHNAANARIAELEAQIAALTGKVDGWKLVPVEPTETMVVCGFESWPDEFFSEPEEWAAYEAMTGCQQAAHKARLCYAAMLAAAPVATVAPAVDAQPVAIYQVQTGDCWLDMTKEQFDNHSKSRPTRILYASAQSEGLRKDAIRREALEEAAAAVRAEQLADPTDSPDDIAYDLAVRDCAAAIRALSQQDPQ